MISFNPVEVANNIQNNGGAIPGRKPGRPTREYIQRVLNRVTFLGALFLCIIAGVPMIINAIISIGGIQNSIFAQLEGTTVAVIETYKAYGMTDESELPGQAVTVFAWSSKKYMVLRYVFSVD